MQESSEPKEFASAALRAPWPPGFRVLDLAPIRQNISTQLSADGSDLDVYRELPFVLEHPIPLADAPVELLRAAVTEIVLFEGPVHEREVARRLAFMWLLNRTGPRVVAAAQRGLASAKASDLLEDYGPFWERAGGSDLRLRIRAMAQGRQPELLPPREIVAGAAQIQAVEGSLPIEQLVSRIALCLGFSRVSPEVARTIRCALEQADQSREFAARENLTTAAALPEATTPITQPAAPQPASSVQVASPPRVSRNLSVCADCGNPVSLRAFACPHCGNPQPAGLQAARAAQSHRIKGQGKPNSVNIIGSALKLAVRVYKDSRRR